MREARRLGLASALALALACAPPSLIGCGPQERRPYAYYEERIAPILDLGCQRQSTGCHVDDGTGFALGNLDLSSYESLLARSDALVPYGPYSASLMLLKAGDPIEVQVRTASPPDPAEPGRRYVAVTTDVRHAAGEGGIAQGSSDYALLKQWLDGGYPKNGVPRTTLQASEGECVNGVGTLHGVDLAVPPADPDSYRSFVEDVQPILQERCAGSSCHGARIADLYLTCGSDERERRWNYEVSLRHLSESPASSELLRRPLAMRAGGVYHEGGDVLVDTEDADYRTILRWAEDIAARRPELLRMQLDDDGMRFFADRVQPLLVRKGCMFLACHSPAMFHDLRLRGGSRGEFSEIATRKNYEMSKLMLALEASDAGQSRLVAKNLCPAELGGGGVKHRGGALFEDFGSCADPSTRAAPERCVGIDADAGDLNEVPAYCVLARWHAIERQAAIDRGELDAGPGPRALVWVERPEGAGGVTQFHRFSPGADLLWADASTDARGQLAIGSPRSLLAGCGVSGSVDVRGPAVSWDGKRLAFAARTAEDAPLRLYEMTLADGACTPLSLLAPEADSQKGVLLHDFDPSYAPDGRLVFASTRGYLAGAEGLRGPTRTAAALEPNSNLYVLDAREPGAVRQLTFLLDHEIGPSFMADGRLVFTAQKRALDFHQLAGRRMNLDGGDYHPLLAQRASIGFAAATEIVELPNRDFVFVAGPLDAADGAGALAVFNRSIGPDQDDRDPKDRAYVHALRVPLPSALDGDSGAFRSPSPLPSGHVVAACDLDAASLSSGAPRFGLCELDPSGIAPPQLLRSAGSGLQVVEPVAVYARGPTTVFASRADEINGSTRIEPGADDAVVHYLDMPVLGSLLFANTREGRRVDPRVEGVAFYAAEPPPEGATRFEELGADVVTDGLGRFFESLRPLGHAALEADGSARVRLPGGVPLSLALTDADGEVLQLAADDAPFGGPMRQREATQFYPGERAKQSMRDDLFDGVCAGCHGAISGRELDVGFTIDVLSTPSKTLASDALTDLR